LIINSGTIDKHESKKPTRNVTFNYKDFVIKIDKRSDDEEVYYYTILKDNRSVSAVHNFVIAISIEDAKIKVKKEADEIEKFIKDNGTNDSIY